MTHRPVKSSFLLISAVALVGCAEDSSQCIGVDELIEDARYCYACGNEVLHLPDGRTFYPLPSGEQNDVIESSYDTSHTSSSSPLIQIAPSGPGDGTGTLTIFEDDMAYWASDSGTEAWLTGEPQEYGFIC